MLQQAAIPTGKAKVILRTVGEIQLGLRDGEGSLDSPTTPVPG
jgi:hypothetical protein